MTDFSIRSFEAGDVSSSLLLCRAAGWNQLHTDWERLLEREPRGCFVAEIDRQLVGTVTTIRYGTELAWIGMMLVHDGFRRLGIGTALMQSALQFLRDLDVQCIKLDATPAGMPVYSKLGFQGEGTFHRWTREGLTAQPDGPSKDENAHAQRQLNQEHFELDRRAFGSDRKFWLERLSQSSVVCVRDHGFGMLRAGYLANYLGPLVASDPAEARGIASELLGASTGKVFWDVPCGNPGGIELAIELGFDPVRELTRMWTGSKPRSTRMEYQYAICDPGTG